MEYVLFGIIGFLLFVTIIYYARVYQEDRKMEELKRELTPEVKESLEQAVPQKKVAKKAATKKVARKKSARKTKKDQNLIK